MNSSPSGREAILGRIREALQDVPAGEQPAAVAVTRAYQHSGTSEREEMVERFIERVADYKVNVRRVCPPPGCPRKLSCCATIHP